MERTTLVNGHEIILSHEPVQILNEDGTPTGSVGTLNEVVEAGLWCPSTHVWLINEKGELYIQQRSFKVFNNPGKWGEASGGYISAGRGALETALVELHEELGLTIAKEKFQELGIIRQLEHRADGVLTRQFVTVYLVRDSIRESDITHCPVDVMGGKFIFWKDLKKQIEEGTIDFIDHADELALVFRTLEAIE